METGASGIPIGAGRPRDPVRKLILFHRDFRGFTGGHLKVWNYFSHVLASNNYEPRVAFTAQSKWDTANPWFRSPDLVTKWEPERADLLFLAGTDWRALAQPDKFTKPIINFIQHPRHAEKKSELRSFLKNRAIRICVSEEVAEAINRTGEVNGPVFVIPNGVDLAALPKAKPWERRGTDILICGLKAPDLAREVYTGLTGAGKVVRWLIEWIPRDDYLVRLTDAKITVFLPRPVEGFYLPPLEGMACETVVVCPDCEGNRGFCLDGENCFRPSYDASSIMGAAEAARKLAEAERDAMITSGRATVAGHSLAGERASFFEILTRIDELK